MATKPIETLDLRYTMIICCLKLINKIILLHVYALLYSTGQKKPNRERYAECLLKAFHFALPKRSSKVFSVRLLLSGTVCLGGGRHS